MHKVNVPRKVTPIEIRFWSKVEIIPLRPCWEWKGCKGRFGHGRLNLGRAGLGSIRAHRFSYELHYGKIPNGLLVCHKCDNPSCVRPDHLFLGTSKDNSLDMISKGRGKAHFSSGKLDSRSNGGKHNKLKTHCPKGHEYAGQNLIVYHGKRSCRTCVKSRKKVSDAKN